MGEAPRRRRRGEARQAILDAARELFAANGYRGTSLQDIAKAGSVSESRIYRLFGTKAQVFREAVVQPYEGFMKDYLERIRAEEPGGNEEMVSRFVLGLYDFVTEHRDLLFALVAASRFGDADFKADSALSEDALEIAKSAASESWRGLEDVDLEVAVPLTTAMVLATVLLDDFLFPHGRRHPSRERLAREMTAYAIAAIQSRARPGDLP